MRWHSVPLQRVLFSAQSGSQPRFERVLKRVRRKTPGDERRPGSRCRREPGAGGHRRSLIRTLPRSRTQGPRLTSLSPCRPRVLIGRTRGRCRSRLCAGAGERAPADNAPAARQIHKARKFAVAAMLLAKTVQIHAPFWDSRALVHRADLPFWLDAVEEATDVLRSGGTAVTRVLGLHLYQRG
jgi:hypothetical protein